MPRLSHCHLLHAAVLALLAASSTAGAHGIWLAPEERSQKPGADVRLTLSAGERFPAQDASLERDSIERAACRQRNAAVPVRMMGGNGKKPLRLQGTPPLTGGVLCWVQLRPSARVLAPEHIAPYLDDMDASAELRQAWASVPEPRRWHETITRNAKVIVPMRGQPSASGMRPVGLQLEFVPDTDLSSGVVRGTLAAQVLLGGLPLAGLSVELLGEHKGDTQRQRSDARGMVRFPAPGPGRWMLSGTDLRMADAKNGVWQSQAATLVFEILH